MKLIIGIIALPFAVFLVWLVACIVLSVFIMAYGDMEEGE